MTTIKHTISGKQLQTKVSLLRQDEFFHISKKNGWYFDWTVEFTHPLRKVYKLTTLEAPQIIQGIVSLEVLQQHAYLHLVENAPFNVGMHKLYSGVALNLLSFACRLSFANGSDGCVQFISEPELVDHYQRNWRAVHLGRQLMMITPAVAKALVNG